MEYLIKSANAATQIAPSSGPSAELFSAGENGSTAVLAPSLALRAQAGSRSAPDEGAAQAPAFVIVGEAVDDVIAREILLDRAMGPNRRKKSSEKLRRGRRPSEGLAFVARDPSGAVVGTVRLWDVRLGEGGPALLLGPLAVEPGLKSGGIGSALMRHAVAEAARLGHGAVLLVGDAPYYGRFGFSADLTGTLAMPGPYERHRLLALELKDGALDGAKGTIKAAGRKIKGQAQGFVA
ncbi:N-acetyltransferase [Mesorhizobium sp. M2D.F.Ca.ET.185.01.1.1]|uniref:GNAT family N-acetyltransferase n=1 Tax=unclassified Mesorhizobium TaxID=325217 RepID=UPI000FCCDA72|nr:MULTISPECIES: N-acetyltransferase [unclassified Mesorhizobium]TGP82639.1 N-acetyltransferase [bacterium M00.F.Ca.ET.227.01.1.1]TGP94393.1 N-acetyltransferase [bacterium M00.F.Ca.ET.221.01.1.1]TGP97847.1 N-acetyltransferase [bacterium M00.F.Ca.ET.222.01.1.1]TGT75054.1 N-acetyltransferase [bacterium M00.F.Ca.ET.159.01.1.1]TGT87921.1 N-acetyltransferase [bacterium M00.F.Ca.ET.157.01.1.1]TGU11841.1 N-acetyltransferase [bacterium M00.F.Ca.ET.163.01.1.1]TGU35905.1 N-acetyltransferase [bacterium